METGAADKCLWCGEVGEVHLVTAVTDVKACRKEVRRCRGDADSGRPSNVMSFACMEPDGTRRFTGGHTDSLIGCTKNFSDVAALC